MSKGKTAAQVAHASLGAYKKAKKQNPKKVAEWESEGSKKIVLVAPLEKLIELKGWADSKGLPAYLVVDAGMTELPPNTITVLGIGPCDEKDLVPTEELPLL